MTDHPVLKPCPFCGNATDLYTAGVAGSMVFVQCGRCGANSPFALDPAVAVEHHNRRVPALPNADALQAIIAANGETARLAALATPGPLVVIGGNLGFDLEPMPAGIRAAFANEHDAQLLAHLVNSRPWEAVTTLLALIAMQNTTIAEQAALLRQCDERIASLNSERERAIDALRDAHAGQVVLLAQCEKQSATHEARCKQVADVRAWLVRHHGAVAFADVNAARELQKILTGGDDAHS
jgi:hypothetical protein